MVKEVKPMKEKNQKPGRKATDSTLCQQTQPWMPANPDAHAQLTHIPLAEKGEGGDASPFLTCRSARADSSSPPVLYKV